MNITLGGVQTLGSGQGVVACEPIGQDALAVAGSKTYLVPSSQGWIQYLYYAQAKVLDNLFTTTDMIYGAYDTQEQAKSLITITDSLFVMATEYRAWACTWNGSSVGRGSVRSLPARTIGANTARIDDNTFIIAGSVSSLGKAFIGVVNGTSLTFSSPYTFKDAGVENVDVCVLDGDNFVISYGSGGTTYCVSGSRSGYVLSFGTPTSLSTGFSVSGDVTIKKLDDNRFIAAYKSATGVPVISIGTVSVTSISFAAEVVADSTATGTYEARNIRFGCCLSPPANLWPRRVFVSYAKNNGTFKPTSSGGYYTKYGLYMRMGLISENGSISFQDSPFLVKDSFWSSSDLHAMNLWPISTWESAVDWVQDPYLSSAEYLYARTLTMDAVQQDLTLYSNEELQVSTDPDFSMSREIYDVLAVLGDANVRPNKVADESFSLSETISWLSALTRDISENLSLVDDWQIGGDFGFMKSFSEQFGLSADLMNDPQKLAEEIIHIYQRLRLAGAFDNTNTRIAASILKAGMTTEKL